MNGALKPDGRVRIVPSLLAADFAALGEALAAVSGETDWASVDVMDGHFVPNLSFGPDHVRALKKRAPKMCLDAHLMVEDPVRYGPVFAEAGADIVTGHVEAAADPERFLRGLQERGTAAGLAVKPATPASAVLPYLARLDLVLVMTVEPGFGGQEFLAQMLEKVRELREAIDRSGRPVWLMVDGGVNAETVGPSAQAGADALVAGSAVFRAKDPAGAVRSLRECAQAGFEKGRRVSWR